MVISVRPGVTLCSTPAKPSSASSRFRNSYSSALNTPSRTILRFRESLPTMVFCRIPFFVFVFVGALRGHGNSIRQCISSLFFCFNPIFFFGGEFLKCAKKKNETVLPNIQKSLRAVPQLLFFFLFALPPPPPLSSLWQFKKFLRRSRVAKNHSVSHGAPRGRHWMTYRHRKAQRRQLRQHIFHLRL